MKTREQVEAEARNAAATAFYKALPGRVRDNLAVRLDAAIAAYEQALWQPISEAQKNFGEEQILLVGEDVC